MLCLYASSPTAVSGQESYWQDDWHTDCPISTLNARPMSRTLGGRGNHSQLIGQAACQSTFQYDSWTLSTVGELVQRQSISLEIMWPWDRCPDRVTWLLTENCFILWWPHPSFFWYDTDFLEFESFDFIDHILQKSVSYQKKDGCTHPSFGMTTPKLHVRSVFSWHTLWMIWTRGKSLDSRTTQKLFNKGTCLMKWIII